MYLYLQTGYRNWPYWHQLLSAKILGYQQISARISKGVSAKMHIWPDCIFVISRLLSIYLKKSCVYPLYKYGVDTNYLKIVRSRADRNKICICVPVPTNLSCGNQNLIFVILGNLLSLKPLNLTCIISYLDRETFQKVHQLIKLTMALIDC